MRKVSWVWHMLMAQLPLPPLQIWCSKTCLSESEEKSSVPVLDWHILLSVVRWAKGAELKWKAIE